MYFLPVHQRYRKFLKMMKASFDSLINWVSAWIYCQQPFLYWPTEGRTVWKRLRTVHSHADRPTQLIMHQSVQSTSILLGWQLGNLENSFLWGKRNLQKHSPSKGEKYRAKVPYLGKISKTLGTPSIFNLFAVTVIPDKVHCRVCLNLQDHFLWEHKTSEINNSLTGDLIFHLEQSFSDLW